jgi:hypothetical protein
VKTYTEEEAAKMKSHSQIEILGNGRKYPRKRAIEIAAQKLHKGWRPMVISSKQFSASGRRITRYLPGQVRARQGGEA